MRLAPIVPALVLVLSCGPSRLSLSEADRDIRQDYPVVVDIRVPESASAIKGSPEHARLVALQEQLSKTGWFSIDRSPEGDRERFSFKAGSTAPTFIRTTPKGYAIPAAEAEFVRAFRVEPARGGAAQDELKVTYRVRLVHPTAQFAIFQALHPEVKLGDTHDRQAVYRREGRSWMLRETNETFKKAD